jgi:hypothetical protein
MDASLAARLSGAGGRSLLGIKRPYRTQYKSTAGVIKTHCRARAQNLPTGSTRIAPGNPHEAVLPCPFKNLCVRPQAGRTHSLRPQASPEGSPLRGLGDRGHQGLFVSNRSMICFFSFDETLGGGTAGGVIPAGPTPPTASLAPAVGFAESSPMLATKPLPGVMSV